MKLSKLALALSTLVCLGGVFIVSGCGGFGDGDVNGPKWDATMTLDATDIKVGDKAMTDMAGTTTADIVADTTADSAHLLKYTGKRYFKQISSTNDNQGIRTNIVINTADALNSETKRKATVGFIFDMNEYDGKWDFTMLGINPLNETYYVERYVGVSKKAAADGVYFSNVTQISDCYYLTTENGNWSTSMADNADKTEAYDLPTGLYSKDTTAKTLTVGVDIKQTKTGEYEVKLGKISTADDGTTTFTGKTVAKIGDPNGSSSIQNYTNWTHSRASDTTTPLQGRIAVYGFAPFGTKISATFTTGKTKAKSGQQDENTDYVNAFSLAGDVEDDVYAPSLF